MSSSRLMNVRWLPQRLYKEFLDLEDFIMNFIVRYIHYILVVVVMIHTQMFERKYVEAIPHEWFKTISNLLAGIQSAGY
jgi:hypothetical protein